MKSFIFYSLLFACFIPSYSLAKDCSKEYKAMKQATDKLKQATDKLKQATDKWMPALAKWKEAYIEWTQANDEWMKTWSWLQVYKGKEAKKRWKEASDNLERVRYKYLDAFADEDQARRKRKQASDREVRVFSKWKQAVKMYDSCNQTLSE